MKPTPTAALLAALFSVTAIHAGPPGPPPPFRGDNGALAGQPRPQPAVTEEELGPARDRFETYRKLAFEGFRYYLKPDEALRLTHAEIYRKIRDNTLNERLTVPQARGFVLRLLEISRANTAPDDGTAATVADNLDELAKTLDATLLDKVNGDILTPDLNRREWLMDELVHFAADTQIATARRSILVNRLEDLLGAEDRAKQDGALTDKARDKLLESSVETWKVFVRTFNR